MPSWKTVCILCSLLMLHNAQRMAPVPLLEELRIRLATDYVGAGNLFGAYLVTYALFTVPAGLLADRMDAKRLVTAGAALSMLASALFAVAGSYPIALVARLGQGASGAIMYVPSLRYVVSSFPSQQRGTVMGFMEAGAGVGQIFALTALPFLAGRLELAQAFLGVPVLAGLVLASILGGLHPSRSAAGSGKGSGDLLRLVRSTRFWYLVAFHFLGMLSIYALLGWIPTYFRTQFGYSAVEAGLVASLLNLGMGAFSPLAGTISDRLRARTPVVLAGSILLALVLGMLMVTQDPLVALIACALGGVAIAFCIPVLMILAGESFDRFGAGLALSISGTAGQIGGSLSGSVFGYALEATGSFPIVWGLALAVGTLRLPLLFAVGERRRPAPEAGKT